MNVNVINQSQVIHLTHAKDPAKRSSCAKMPTSARIKYALLSTITQGCNAPSLASDCLLSILRALVAKPNILLVSTSSCFLIKSHYTTMSFQIVIGRPWQSCAIYCKKAVNDEFYTPRFELNNIQDLNAFFPDGTWCGKDDQNKDLYCLQRNCVSGVKKTSVFSRN